ncbi:MAG: pyruvate dehydrogenase, partial [Chloroflexi bacterium]|nr:pyruvate dehydrogenase [Chloroflexota bacterium]
RSSGLRSPTALTPAIPTSIDHEYRGSTSSQQVYGLVLTDLARNLPEVADRIVTVSPDVASSTGLGGWINRAGVWNRTEPEQLPEEDESVLRWNESSQGQHIELGISENNLFMMLGQLGQSFEANGELLFPIGTLYDPFVRRGLDAFTYGLYSDAKFIVVGTPSGITLAPEGGAHQSFMTPSIGAEMPALDFYEPCFGKEVEWIMLSALEQVRRRERSTYLRLTSRRVEQSLFNLPDDTEAQERLRRQVLSGAYRLVSRASEPQYAPGENVVNIMAIGAMIPDAIEASEELLREGVFANVINITGPGPLYRRYQEGIDAAVAGSTTTPFLAGILSTEERQVPVVAVADAHPHSLAWIGGALGTRIMPLGVSEFGQSGTRSELYKEYGIDVDSIVAACFTALDI